MKEIKVFIRHNKIDNVIDALGALDHPPGLTLSDVRGFGHPKEGRPAKLTECVKLKTVVPDDQVNIVLKTIIANTRTGRHGNGKIFVSSQATAIPYFSQGFMV